METQWVWIDLELTGLDLAKDVIIEISVFVTDKQLENLTEGPSLVVQAQQHLLEGMTEVVKNMHESSGLTQAVQQSQTTLAEAETQVLEFLESKGVKEGVLAGNSIHMDRLFLLKDMPRLFESVLHPYKIMDVSTFKELFKAWKSPTAEPPKASGHRSRDDILGSIQEFRFYKSLIG